jgi:acetyl-CoA synthetase
MRLGELVYPTHDSWESAGSHVRPPSVGRYNIAADCCEHPPERTALVVVEGQTTRPVTFGELRSYSSRFAAALHGLGVVAGDRVAIRLSQSLEMAVAVIGTLAAGAVVVPVSTMLGDDALRHRLVDSDSRVFVCTGADLEIEIAAQAGVHVVTTEPTSGYPQLSELLRDAKSQPPAETFGDTPGLLLYTSGTEGKSKGVLHGHRVLPGHYALDFALDHVRPTDVSYTPVDWAWGGGLLLGLLTPLAYGIPVVAYRQPGFDPERTLRLMRETGASVGLFPPTVLRMLRHAVSSKPVTGLRLRSLVSGAESVEAELVPWAKEALGATVNNAYGQTEANILLGHSDALGPMDPETLGKPYPGRRIGVLDENLAPVAPGEQGQLAIGQEDPVCLIEYWRNPTATQLKLRDGWLLTGDTVHVDPRGQFHFHGRNDDIIKAAGYRIGPAEVEAALLRHPQVMECAVVGVPDPVRGGAVAAFVRLSEQTPAAQQTDALIAEFQAEVRARVGPHAYPRQVHFVTDLPRTTTGKVDRGALRSRTQAPSNENAPEALDA